MLRAYKYRLYPTRAQEAALVAQLGAACDLYNAALEERIDRYRKTGKTFGYAKQALSLKECRAVDERLAACSFSMLQQVLRRLDKAFAAFFRRVKWGEAPGFPRFQAKSRFDTLEFRVGDGLNLKAGRLRIVGVPSAVKVKWHRPLPEDAKLGQATISRNGGAWHVTLSAELPDPAAIANRPQSMIGVDLGVSSLVALSDGTTIEAPR